MRHSTRARACSGCRTQEGPRSTGSPATAIRRRSAFPVARVPGLDFSFSGLKTALLYTVRDLAPGELEAAPRRPRGELPAGDRPCARRANRGRRRRPRRDRRRRGGQLGAPARRSRTPSRHRCALHRQRRDDRLGGPVSRAVPSPEYLALDAFASSSLSFCSCRSRSDRRRGLVDGALAPSRRPRRSCGGDDPLVERPRRLGTTRDAPAEPDDRRPPDARRSPSASPSAKLATEATERRWDAEDYAAQQQVLTQLARHGLATGRTTAYARVIDGFSAVLDPRAVPLLEHNPEVAGRLPRSRRLSGDHPDSPLPRRRRRRPSRTSPCRASTARASRSALLDTGVDYDASRTSKGSVEPGVDIVGGTGDAAAAAQPAGPAADRASTEPSSPASSPAREARDGVHGVAPGADRAADPGRRLAADRERARRGVRPLRPGDRRPRARRRPERRRRRARRGADRTARRRGAVRRRSPTAPRRRPSTARSRSTCSWSRPPGTTARRAALRLDRRARRALRPL